MKIIVNNTNIQVAVICFLGLNVCFAQSNNNPESASSRQGEIKSQIVDYQTALSAYEANIQTNDVAPNKRAVNEMLMAMQPLKDAMNTLDNSWSPLVRQQRAALWFEILSAIDTNLYSPFLTNNVGLVSMIEYIPPPAGYQGKVGLYGMLPPDTNDAAACSYYITARKTYRIRRFAVNIQTSLEYLNQEATARFEMFLRANYSSSDSDRKEFDQIVNTAPLSVSRQQQLKLLFDKTH
jgi:hypothetical protein